MSTAMDIVIRLSCVNYLRHSVCVIMVQSG